MTAPPPEPARRPAARRWTAVGVAALLVTLAAAALMLRNASHLHDEDPHLTPELAALKSALRQTPEDAGLRQQVRVADRDLRMDFFRRQSLGDRGGWVLLLGAVVGVAALKRVAELRKPLPTPRPPAGRSFHGPAMGGVAAAAVGAALAAGALIALFPPVPLPRMPEGNAAAEAPPAAGVAAAGQPVAAAPATPFDPDAYRINWPSFRGPRGNGTAVGPMPPLRWDPQTGEHIAWTAAIDLPGKNTPVVWGGRVFLSGADEQRRAVYCIDAATGERRWTHAVDDVPRSPRETPLVLEDTGYAAATVATDGTRVYAIFANGDLVACTLDGQRVWARSLGLPENDYGHASSLITHGHRLIVQYDQGGGRSGLFAFDGATGEPAWSVPREGASWASPIIARMPSGDQLITVPAEFVTAHDPQTGAELWRYPGPAYEIASTPAASPAHRLVLFIEPLSYLTAVRSDGRGDVSETAPAWEGESGVPDISSPACDETYAVLASIRGEVTCYRLADGTVAWQQQLDGEFIASPVLIDGRAYVFAKDGTGYVLRLGETFEQLARNRLREGVSASPAIVEGRLYIRAADTLICIAESAP